MSDPRDAYLEAQVLTATPQRLRLMLIEGAIRFARTALEEWQRGAESEGQIAVSRCRGVISELLGGIKPESEVALRTIDIYTFLYRRLIDTRSSADAATLAELLPVLEEERITWQRVCDELPHAPQPVREQEIRAQGPAVQAPSFLQNSPGESNSKMSWDA